MKSETDKLLKKHDKLIHTENIKVVSHVQREDGEWFINTLMLEKINTPFKYKRKKLYRTLTGQRVNITYYRDIEVIAGMEIEVMNIVRVKVA